MYGMIWMHYPMTMNKHNRAKHLEFATKMPQKESVNSSSFEFPNL